MCRCVHQLSKCILEVRTALIDSMGVFLRVRERVCVHENKSVSTVYAFFCSKVCLEALLQHCYLRRLIQHSLSLFSPLLPIYECPGKLLSVCKHTTPGQNPMHIFCSHPIKHTLNNLLWSLFIGVRAIDLKPACMFCRRLLTLIYEFYKAKMMTHEFSPLSCWKWIFDLCFIVL